MVKVERDKEMPQASFVSLELRTTNKKTAQNKRCNIRKDGKGILLRSSSILALTVQQLRLVSSLHFHLPFSAPSLDVLKGHVKYSGSIFITVLSGNTRGLISLSARGQSGLPKREVEYIRLLVNPFFHSF